MKFNKAIINAFGKLVLLYLIFNSFLFNVISSKLYKKENRSKQDLKKAEASIAEKLDKQILDCKSYLEDVQIVTDALAKEESENV